MACLSRLSGEEVRFELTVHFNFKGLFCYSETKFRKANGVLEGASILCYSVTMRSDYPKELPFLLVPCRCVGYNEQCEKRWHGGGEYEQG